MIVCWRTARIPRAERERFGAWVQANRAVRQQHGILFELVLNGSARQNPAKAPQPPPPPDQHGNNTDGVLEAVVITGWASHDAFDAWITTPDRDRLTASPVHQAVTFGPITRYDTTGGYLNLDGLRAIPGTLDAVGDTRKEQP